MVFGSQLEGHFRVINPDVDWFRCEIVEGEQARGTASSLHRIGVLLNQTAHVIPQRSFYERKCLGARWTLCQPSFADDSGELGSALGFQVLSVERVTGWVDERPDSSGDDSLNVAGDVIDRQRCEQNVDGLTGCESCGLGCVIWSGLERFCIHGPRLKLGGRNLLALEEGTSSDAGYLTSDVLRGKRLGLIMRFLYKAFAFEDSGDDTKVLMPGYPVSGNSKQPQPGDPLHVELADGTRLQTKVVATQHLSFTESAATRLRARPGFYCAVTVPRDFDVPGVELGVQVYVEE